MEDGCISTYQGRGWIKIVLIGGASAPKNVRERGPNNHSLRQSNPLVIPDDRKQTSARHTSRKTIQRLIEEIHQNNFMSIRNTKKGSSPIRCQMDNKLKRRQMKNKTTSGNKTHPNLIEDDAPDTPPPARPRCSTRLALPQ